MMKNPCKGCFDRTITCHGVCRRYQDWTQEHEKEKKWRREQMPFTSERALKGQRERIRKIQRGQIKSRAKNYD